MDWRDDLVAHLPAPRNDEPASLRQDIVDELSDHLACALNRELLRTHDAREARDQVLRRFGNPRGIARQLWLDAMKEKIMAQRVTLILTTILAIACLVACALLWMAIQRGRQFDAAVLKELAELRAIAQRASQPVSTSPDWNPLKVHLVLDEAADKPAVGYTALLRGYPLSAAQEMSMRKETDADGIADFGIVRPGRYTLDVTTPWGEEHSRSFVVKPGLSHMETVPCPRDPPADVDVTISVDWPEDLVKAGYWVLCEFSRASRRVGDHLWQSTSGSTTVVVTPTGELLQYSESFLIQPYGPYYSSSPKPIRPGLSEVALLKGTCEQKGRVLRWAAATYQLKAMAVVMPPTEMGDFSEVPILVVSPDRMLGTLERRQRQSQSTEPISVFEVALGAGSRIPVTLSDEFQRDCRVASVTASLAEETVRQAGRSSNTLRMAVACFLELDRDRNGELSEAEFAQYVNLPRGLGRPPKLGNLPESLSPPLSRDQFVRHYLSLLPSRTSRSAPSGLSKPGDQTPEKSQTEPEAESKPAAGAPTAKHE